MALVFRASWTNANPQESAQFGLRRSRRLGYYWAPRVSTNPQIETRLLNPSYGGFRVKPSRTSLFVQS